MGELAFHETYNRFPSIAEASSRFQKLLALAGETETQFFNRLVPLFFSEGNASRESGPNYSPCLIHRHFPLRQGERMVWTENPSENSSTGKPEKPENPEKDNIRVVPESWLSSGQEFEHRRFRVNDPRFIPEPEPPSADFFSQFKAILGNLQVGLIDVMGICYNFPRPEPEHIYLETLDHGNRSLTITQVPASSLDPDTTIPSTWTFTVGGGTLSGGSPFNGGCIPKTICTTVCANCPPIAQRRVVPSS